MIRQLKEIPLNAPILLGWPSIYEGGGGIIALMRCMGIVESTASFDIEFIDLAGHLHSVIL